MPAGTRRSLDFRHMKPSAGSMPCCAHDRAGPLAFVSPCCRWRGSRLCCCRLAGPDMGRPNRSSPRQGNGSANRLPTSKRVRTIPAAMPMTRVYDNPFFAAREQPLSTFSIAVDTASYSNVRRLLNEGSLPPKDAVRIADFVNYFPYDYPEPTGEHPISITADAAGCPWSPDHRLVRIGLRGKRIAAETMPPRNLVFLIDVSGSMDAPNRLPLVKTVAAFAAGSIDGPRPRGHRRLCRGRRPAAARPRPARTGKPFAVPSKGWPRPAAPTAAKASSWPIASPRKTSSRAASTASSWRPTAISTSALPARASWFD